MIDIKSKTCMFENCKTLPTYNFKGETKALYCSIHKKDNMINIKSKSCLFENCRKQPIYNIEGETKALYCSIHKKRKYD